MLKVQSLTLAFGESVVIEDINFSLERGEKLAIMGPNGSGKTTLIRAISGLHTPSGGRILINGADIADSPASSLPVAFVPGNSLIPWFTLKRAVCYLPVCRGLDNAEAKFKRLSKIVGLDTSILHQSPQEISAGQYQRAVLVQSLMLLVGRSILILDEPFVNLDREIREELMVRLPRLFNEACVVLVTHSDEEAVSLCEGRIHEVKERGA